MADADRCSTGGLYLGPVLRPLSSDSEFFDEGNTNRALLCKLNVFAIMSGGADAMDLHEDQHQFECMFQDCTATFSSLKRHEEHYETSHRHRCFTCGRSFPTHRLLDLHLSEAHDSFFRAMAERRPMYACLVEGCPEVFESSGKRHEHLVEAHLYPESFDFSRREITAPSYTRTKARAKRAKDRGRKGGNLDVEPAVDGRKGKLRAREAKTGASNEAEMVTATQRVGTSHPHSAPGPTDTNSRRSGQGPAAPRPPLATAAAAAAAAASPRMACRFWRTAGGCRRGNDCKFVHAVGAGGDAPKGVKVKEAFVVGGAAASILVGSGGGSGSGRSGGNGGGGGRGGGGGGGWGGRSSLSRAGARDDVGVVLDSGGVENGVGVASAEGMVVMEEDDDGVSSSGGVEELINGMSKLLIPRQMGFGSSSRRGDPIRGCECRWWVLKMQPITRLFLNIAMRF
ncbi:unnamed protein product [Ectocarpus sp. 6 AP-2014]